MGTRQALQAIRGRLPTRLYPWDRVRIAERAGITHGTNPRTAAHDLGIRLHVGRAAGCGGEATSGDTVVIGHDRDPRRRALLAWHGIAHVLLQREGWDHDEGDAWLLTLELACPHAVAHDDGLEARTWLPAEVVRAWVPVSRRLGLRVAA